MTTIKNAKIENFKNIDLINFFNYINNNMVLTTDIDDVLLHTQRFCSFRNLKCGRGSSHIWVSDENNERLGVIYFR